LLATSIKLLPGGVDLVERVTFRRGENYPVTISARDAAAVGSLRRAAVTIGRQFYAVAGKVYEETKKRGLRHEIPTSLFLQDIRN
jgi:hypothetical protein